MAVAIQLLKLVRIKALLGVQVGDNPLCFAMSLSFLQPQEPCFKKSRRVAKRLPSD